MRHLSRPPASARESQAIARFRQPVLAQQPVLAWVPWQVPEQVREWLPSEALAIVQSLLVLQVLALLILNDEQSMSDNQLQQYIKQVAASTMVHIKYMQQSIFEA